MSWMDFYDVNYHHNVAFSSLRNYAQALYDVGFTEADLGLSFVFNEAGDVRFERYNPLSEIGRQINIEPLPSGVGNTAIPLEGTPSLHNWSEAHQAQKLVSELR